MAKRTRSHSGFTLMELLVGLAVAAAAGLTLLSGLSLAGRLEARGRGLILEAHDRLLTDHLFSAWLGAAIADGPGEAPAIAGGAREIAFKRLSVQARRAPALESVRFEIRSGRDGDTLWLTTEDALDGANREERAILASAGRLAFSYRSDGTWAEELAEGARLDAISVVEETGGERRSALLSAVTPRVSVACLLRPDEFVPVSVDPSCP